MKSFPPTHLHSAHWSPHCNVILSNAGFVSWQMQCIVKFAECYEEGRRVHLSPYRQVPNVQRGSSSHSTGTRSRHTEFAGTGSYSNPQCPAIWISLHLLNKTPREDMGASQLPHIFNGFFANTRPHLFCLECAERLF